MRAPDHVPICRLGRLLWARPDQFDEAEILPQRFEVDVNPRGCWCELALLQRALQELEGQSGFSAHRIYAGRGVLAISLLCRRGHLLQDILHSLQISLLIAEVALA